MGRAASPTKVLHSQLAAYHHEWLRLNAAQPNLTYRLSIEQTRHRPVIPWYREWHGCFGCEGSSVCCSGHGKCALGVCKCEPGYRGIDCATTDVSAAGPAPSSLAIYVYDLPPALALEPMALRTWRRGGRKIYSAEWRFLDMLLRGDWRARTHAATSASTCGGIRYGMGGSGAGLLALHHHQPHGSEA